MVKTKIDVHCTHLQRYDCITNNYQRLLPQVFTFLAFKTNNCWIMMLATDSISAVQIIKKKEIIYFTAFCSVFQHSVYLDLLINPWFVSQTWHL